MRTGDESNVIDTPTTNSDHRWVNRLSIALAASVALVACHADEATLGSTSQAIVNTAVSPSSDFGTIQIGSTSSPITVIVRPSVGPNDDYVQSVTASCPDYQIDAPNLPAEVLRTCDGGCLTCACVTLDYVTYPFTVTFAPTVPGMTSCPISIVTMDASSGALSTRTVTLTGTGEAPPIRITATPGDVAFGDVRRNTASSPAEVDLGNAGGSTMTVSAVSISPGFAIASGPTGGFTVDPGATMPYQITCNPTDLGALTGTLTFDSDDPATPSLAIPLSCNGIDSSLDLSPSPAVMSTVRVGEPTQITITIANVGAAASTLESVAVTGDVTAMSLPAANTQIAGSGGTAQAVIGFPATAAGDASGTLVVTYDGGQQRTAQITARALATSMSVSPDGVVDFGPVCAQQTKQQTFTVLANAAGSFQLQSISAPAAPFTIAPPALPAAVAGAGASSVAFAITAAPTAEGVVTSHVDLATDIPNATAHGIDLAVTGLPAGVTATPAMVDLGSNPIDQTTIGQPVQLSNCGAAPITASNARITGPDAADFAIVAQPTSAMIAPTANAAWLVVMQAHAVGAKVASFEVDYDGGTASVMLVGEGLGASGGGDSRDSYYTCDAGAASAAWPLVGVLVLQLRRRRRT